MTIRRLGLCIVVLLAGAPACAHASGWVLTSAIGTPGSTVGVDVIFESDGQLSGGSIRFGFDDRVFEVTAVQAVEGTCMSPYPGSHLATFASAAPDGRSHVACRMQVRILPQAYPRVVSHYLVELDCRAGESRVECTAFTGAIKIDGPPAPYPYLRFEPSPLVAGHPVRAYATFVCLWPYHPEGADHGVSVTGNRVRIHVMVIEPAFICPDFTPYEMQFDLPRLAAGGYRVELLADYYGSEEVEARVLDLANITVADSLAGTRPVPATGASAAIVLIAMLALSARALRTS